DLEHATRWTDQLGYGVGGQGGAAHQTRAPEGRGRWEQERLRVDAGRRAVAAGQQPCDEQQTCRFHRSPLPSSSTTPGVMRGAGVAPDSAEVPLEPSKRRNQARAGTGRPWRTATG